MEQQEEKSPLLFAFVLMLVFVSIPVKNLAYLAPLLYLGVRWLQKDVLLIRRVAVVASLLIVTSSLAMLSDHLAGREISLAATAWAFVTYCSFLIVLCHGRRERISDETFYKFITVCGWFVVIQSLIGLGQFAATGNPDAVCGTFGLLDGFIGRITIAQVYFTFTLFGMMLFILAGPMRPLSAVALLMGCVACVVAQSGHQTLFILFTIAACTVLRRWSVVGALKAATAFAFLAGLLFAVYPNTISLAESWYAKTVINTKSSPKAMAVVDAKETLLQPKNFLLGVGLGQYTSRAALIASNEYLNADLPAALAGSSYYYQSDIKPLIRQFEEVGEGSAVSKPYMSAMSLSTELGVPLFLMLLVAIALAMHKNLLFSLNGDAQIARLGTISFAGILFFCLCCLVENYAEFVQAVFLPFLLYVVVESRVDARKRQLQFIGSVGSR